MEPLSNLGQRRDAAGGRAGIVLRRAQRPEIHTALQMILGAAGRPAAEEHVVDFLRFALYRSINLDGIWLAIDQDRLAFAILPVVSPGRTMLLFTPTHITAPMQEPANLLVEHVIGQFQRGAVDLAQVLIDPAEKAAVKLFSSHGFEQLAELIYLERDVRRSAELPLSAGWSWQTYSPQTHDLFARTIQATYAGSFDCPSLNGKRKIDDVIAGHKSAGEFDPKLWFLLRDGDISAGVLLLNRSPRTDALEMVYVGLLPEYRGRGFGDAMLRHAIASATSVGCRRLSLAVDSNNAPALALYRRHSMTRVCSRLALLRDLRELQRVPQGSYA